jgi:type II secretory pathway component PulF
MTRTEQYISYLTIINNSLTNGRSITFALDLIKRQSKSKSEQKRIDIAVNSIKRGDKMSSAFHRAKMFDNDIISYIKIAESSSYFIKIMNNILAFLEEKNRFLRDSKEKISMPIIYFILAIITIFGVKFFAIPQQIKQISTYSKDIQGLVAEHLSEAQFIANAILVIDIFVFFILIVFLYAIYGTKYFAKLFKTISLHVPFVSNVVFLFDKFFTLLFFGQILQGGIDSKKSVLIMAEHTNNIRFLDYFKNILYKMKYGERDIFSHKKIFTPFESDLIAGSSNSNQLGETFIKISNYSKNEAYTGFTSFFRFLTFFSIFLLSATIFLEFYAIVVTQLIIQSNLIQSIGN